MSTGFDFEGVFDEDYLYFYESILTPERSDTETAAIIALLGDIGPGAAILDAPCGHGRIANRLAQRGFRVTGLDATPLFLDVARRDAAEAGLDVEYVHGDLRALPWTGRFDAVINWFTSFGYFDDEENRAVLRSFRSALKPGGKLIIETMNRDRLVRNLPPEGWPARVMLDERGDDLLLDKVVLDEAAGRTNTERIIVRNGRVRRTHFTVRVPTAPELSAWLREAGFEHVEVTGPGREPLTPDSTRMVVVATARSLG